MKIIIVGGHLTPALALIEELKKDNEIIFVGRKTTLEGDLVNSLEYETITKEGLIFVPLTTGRLQRSFTKHTIFSLLKTGKGFFSAAKILKKHKPDVVVSFGGYLSVPIGISAYLFKIPLVIHEQTLEAGLANKILGIFAAKICISWKQSLKYFPVNKTIYTGIPIRKFSNQKSGLNIPNGHLPLIFITGGSAGAHGINILIEACLTNLLEKYRIIHQTGDATEFSDFKRLMELKSTLNEKFRNRYLLTKFIEPDSIGEVIKSSDLVISRSGINTVSELLYYGKPCLLIPLPFGQRGEQLTNAKLVKKIGIGEYMEQSNLQPHQLLAKIEEIIATKLNYLRNAGYAKSLLPGDSTKKIKNIIYEVAAAKK